MVNFPAKHASTEKIGSSESALSGDSPTGSPARNTKALQHNILLIDTD